MITGTSQADAAVIVVPAIEGPQAQTKEHIFLARTLGVKQIVIDINKMDAVAYSQAKYEDAKKAVTDLLKTVGFKVDEIPFVPCSGYKGDNIASRSAKMAWYKGPILVAG